MWLRGRIFRLVFFIKSFLTLLIVIHFNWGLKPDIINHAGTWVLEQFDVLYDPYSGIINHLSESYDDLLKQENERHELPACWHACSRFQYIKENFRFFVEYELIC